MPTVEELDARALRLRLFATSDWKVLKLRLQAHARRKVGRNASEDEAEELAHRAIEHALEHLDGWQHTTVSLIDYLGSILNGIAINERRKGKRRQEELAHEDDVAADSSRAPADPRADESRHLLSNLARTTIARLETLLAGDALALEILALYLREITTPKEQQAATDKEMKAILAARLKIARYATKVAAELEAEVA